MRLQIVQRTFPQLLGAMSEHLFANNDELTPNCPELSFFGYRLLPSLQHASLGLAGACPAAGPSKPPCISPFRKEGMGSRRRFYQQFQDEGKPKATSTFHHATLAVSSPAWSPVPRAWSWPEPEWPERSAGRGPWAWA